jgi:hypothetical protein
MQDWTNAIQRRHFLHEILQGYQDRHGTPPFPTYLNEAEEESQNIYIEEDRDIDEHELDGE